MSAVTLQPRQDGRTLKEEMRGALEEGRRRSVSDTTDLDILSGTATVRQQEGQNTVRDDLKKSQLDIRLLTATSGLVAIK